VTPCSAFATAASELWMFACATETPLTTRLRHQFRSRFAAPRFSTPNEPQIPVLEKSLRLLSTL
jgi:hypothetical protein